MFDDPASFDPKRDGEVPVSRSPLALMARTAVALMDMLCSRNPSDAAVWLRSMVQRRRPLSYPLPWLTFGAIRALRQYAKPGMRVFEYGSGHSTLFWVNQGLEIHAVEDDRNWYHLLEKRMKGHSAAHLYLEETGEGYVSRLARVGGLFDMVVVDGNYRKACLTAALDYVKPDGLLVVDNTDWHWYDDVDDMVPDGWTKTVHPGWAPFIGHPSETTIWQRPRPVALA